MSSPDTSSNGWSEWSKYVLRELERLSDFAKELDKRMNQSDVNHAPDKETISKLYIDLDKLKTDFKTFIDKDFSDLNRTVTNMRISNAKQMGLGGLGGGVITGLIEIIKLLVSK